MFKSNTFRLKTVICILLMLVSAVLVSGSGILNRNNGKVEAAPSTYLNFQARLKSSGGSVVPDGNYNMEFKIYSVSSSGTALWTETHTTSNKVRVANGYMTVSLGSITPFSSSIPWGDQLWLSMNVGGTGAVDWDGEMSPRLLLTSVPHAFKADKANYLTDGTNDYSHNSFVKTAPSSIQGYNSANTLVRLNQTGAGGLLQMQYNGSDVLTLSNAGALALTGSMVTSGDITVNGGDLQGAAAGLTVTGGTNSGANLELRSTSNATRGTIDLRDRVKILTENRTINSSFAFVDMVAIGTGTTLTVTNNSAFRGILFNPTVVYDAPIFLTGGRSFEESSILKNSNGVAKTIPHHTAFYSVTNVQADGAAVTSHRTGFLDAPVYSTINGGTLTAQNHMGFESQLVVNSGANVVNRYALNVDEADLTGGGSMTNQWGLYIEDLTGATNNYGIYVEGAATYALWVDSGTSRFDGNLRVEDADLTVYSGTDRLLQVDNVNNRVGINMWDDLNYSFQSQSSASASQAYGALHESSMTSSTSLYQAGHRFATSYSNPGSSNYQRYTGTEFSLSSELTANTVNNTYRALSVGNYLAGTGSAYGYNGLTIDVGMNDAGSVTDFTGADITLTGSTGSATNAYGIKINTTTLGSGSGTVANNYGMYIADQDSGTNNYGLYIQNADTYSLWVDDGATRLDGNLIVDTNTLFVDAANNRVGIGTTSVAAGFNLQIGDSSGNASINIAPSASGVGAICFDAGTCNTSLSLDRSTGTMLLQNAGTGLTLTSTTATLNKGLVVGSDSGSDSLLVLDTKSTAGDPAGGSNGAMYYNSNSGKLRMYQNGGWVDMGDISNGGNTYASAITIGTNDAYGLNFETAGSNRMTIDSSGNISMTGNLAVDTDTLFVNASTNMIGIGDSTPDYKLDVEASGAAGGAGTTETLASFSLTDTGVVTSGTDTSTALSVTSTRNNATGGTISNIAGNFAAVADNGGSAATTAIGLNASAYGADTTYAIKATGYTAGNTITDLVGVDSKVGTFLVGGTTTNMIAYQAQVDTSSVSATVTTAAGLYVKTAAKHASGTIANNYGIYVADQTAGTNDYGIYIQGAQTYALWVDSGATQLDGTLTVGSTVTYTAGAADTNTAVCRNAAGQLAGCTSASRFKDDVQNLSIGLDELKLLQPVSYTWNTTGKADIGFLAEQVASVIPQAVTYDEFGEISGFNYHTISALLVSGVKELDLKVTSIDTRLASVEQGNFAGNVTVGGSLKVSGTAEVLSLKVNGKIITAGEAPEAEIHANSGQDASVQIEGNDISGKINITSGSANLLAGEQVSVEFTSPYEAAPKVTMTASTQSAGSIRYYVEQTNNGFKLIFIDPPQAGQVYGFNYWVAQ